MFVLILGLGVWALDRWSILPIWPIDPVACLPAEAAVVAALPEMGRALTLGRSTQDDPWQQALIALPGLEGDIALVNRLIDTLFSSRTIIDQAKGLLVLDVVNDLHLGGAWLIDLRNLGTLRPEEWFAAKGLDARASSFRGQPVWTVQLTPDHRIAVGTVRNVLILARQAYQVEAVLAAGAQSGHWVQDLEKAEQEDHLFSLYLNTEKWGDVLNTLFTEGGLEMTRNWTDWLTAVRLDVKASEAGLELRGAFRAGGKWLDGKPAAADPEADLWGLLPQNTGAVRAISLNDYHRFFRRGAAQDQARFQRFFLPWLEGPVLELTLRPFNAELQDRQLFFFAYRDQAAVTAALNSWMEEVGILKAENYQGFVLTQVQEDQNLAPFSAGKRNNPWWTMVGNYVLLATNRASLENWIDQYVVGSAVPLTETVRQISLSGNGAGFAFFIDWQQWRTAWKYIVRNAELAQRLSGLGQLTIRIENSAGKDKLTGLWQLSEAGLEAEQELSWRRALADDVAAGPWLNQDAAGEPLIAVQDAANRLYFLDKSGAIRRQQQLDGQILSEVKTINLRTGPAHTFNTAQAIYLLDPEGRNIAPFPLQLQNSTARPQTVIDFSGDKNYSFFVVSTDGCVYGYDLDAGPIPGWSPKCQMGNVQHPLVHYQDQDRDFLILRNTNGQMRVFMRDGSLRLEGDFPAGEEAALPQMQLLPGSEQVVSCSEGGLVQVLPLAGPLIEFRLPVGNNEGVDLIYSNLTGDERLDFLLTSGRVLNLHAYTAQGLTRQFEQELPQAIKQVFTVAQAGGTRSYIGVLLEGSRRICLLDNKGEMLPGFPLAGSTPFFITDLFGSGEQHLLVGYEDEVLAYRLPMAGL